MEFCFEEYHNFETVLLNSDWQAKYNSKIKKGNFQIVLKADYSEDNHTILRRLFTLYMWVPKLNLIWWILIDFVAVRISKRC